MTKKQWIILNDVIRGKENSPIPVEFIIDSPGLPKWYGIKILDYFSNDELWLKLTIYSIQLPNILLNGMIFKKN